MKDAKEYKELSEIIINQTVKQLAKLELISLETTERLEKSKKILNSPN